MQNPAVALTLWAQMARITFESQMVIALRVAGMMGIVQQSPTEPIRMVAEKQAAAAELLNAAFRAAQFGASAEGVMAAALKPYGRRTHANSRRLSRSARR